MPLQELLRDQRAVGDEHDRLGVELGLGGPLGLEHGDPEPLGDDLRRRRGLLAAAARGPVRPREQERELVPLGQALEHVRAEAGRGGDADPGH